MHNVFTVAATISVLYKRMSNPSTFLSFTIDIKKYSECKWRIGCRAELINLYKNKNNYLRSYTYKLSKTE